MVKLGDRVTDTLTGFSGIATSRTEYLYGCVRIVVEPTELREGKPIDGQIFDEQRLDVASTAKTGGPGEVPRARLVPPR
jgi:hypothetical protein